MDFVEVAHGFINKQTNRQTNKPQPSNKNTLGKFYEILHNTNINIKYWDCFFACHSLEEEETIIIFL